MKKLIYLFIFLSLILGCATVKIKAIKECPSDYKNSYVAIKGVVKSIKVLGEFRLLMIQSDDEKVLFIKYGATPKLNKRIRIKGYVKVISIPLIKDYFYFIGKTANKKIEEYKRDKSEKFHKFIKNLKKYLKKKLN